MSNTWLNRGIALLDQSLNPITNELNEIDWKEKLSPNKDKLKQHLVAFANLSGGGFLVFGIRDSDAKVIGLSNDDAAKVVDRLTSLGRDAIDPPLLIEHRSLEYEGKPILFVYIKESMVKPAHEKGTSLENTFIRSGGTTRKASRQEIGALFLHSKTPQFEELRCSELMSGEQVLDLLDYKKIAELLNYRLSSVNSEILNWMHSEKLIESVDNGGYYITNFGALASAKDLSRFDSLSRKSIRLIKYEGKNKTGTAKEWTGNKGYAIRFSELIEYILDKLPSSEIIEKALRKTTAIYPELAIRELVANALIHQDFSIRGTSPMIEIFDDRLEITNPGKLLPTKKIDRLIGTSPESRNEILAKAFRKYGICEERGSGFVKSVASIEFFGLPPLRFIEGANSFKVIMYSPRKFSEMSQDERIEAVYQHSVIQFLSNSSLTNNSLRERLRMNTKQRPQISLLIKQAIELGRIKPEDPNNSSTKFSKYIPFWAV
ncbi:ATP-binding protein [Rasiella sp. SM2506]|uniref:ATP-binding protein n=1 Tax=Rasiella sp. SM2506 TaxID=3423914 RepID=UPI003D79D9B6